MLYDSEQTDDWMWVYSCVTLQEQYSII
jgi:hypothetical protein